MAGILDALTSIFGGSAQGAAPQTEVPEGMRTILGMPTDEFKNRIRAVAAGMAAPRYDGESNLTAAMRGFSGAQNFLQGQEDAELERQAAAKRAALEQAERSQRQSNWEQEMDLKRTVEERQMQIAERQAADAGKKAPGLVEMYDEKTGMPYKAVWDPDSQSFQRVGGMKAPSGTQLSVDPVTGAVTFQQGAGLKPLTEQQSKDTVYSVRAEGALPLIDEMGNALTSLSESVGGQVPAVGNYLKTPEYQQAEQAGREFLAAILRKDTGAAITSQEMAEYGAVYLPRPGDSPEVLAQKQASRARALAALKAGMPPNAITAQQNALKGISEAGPGITGEAQDGGSQDAGETDTKIQWKLK
ncbi:MAG: hypothetical protein LCH99_01810 [Proteobacteria bacterium]|nr:hypothetical protein [Pseudomonadota bacterium]